MGVNHCQLVILALWALIPFYSGLGLYDFGTFPLAITFVQDPLILACISPLLLALALLSLSCAQSWPWCSHPYCALLASVTPLLNAGLETQSASRQPAVWPPMHPYSHSPVLQCSTTHNNQNHTIISQG